LVIPDVEGYYEDVLELVAPVNVREVLGVSEGDPIEVEIDLDPGSESGAP
jgi:CTP-dependent riboflavin kinase